MPTTPEVFCARRADEREESALLDWDWLAQCKPIPFVPLDAS